MKAIYGKTCLKFINRYLTFVALSETPNPAGTFYRGKNNEYVFIFDDNPSVTPQAQTALRSLLDAKINQNEIFLDEGTRVQIRSEQAGIRGEALLRLCHIDGVSPEDHWTDDVILCPGSKKDLTLIVEMLLIREHGSIQIAETGSQDFPCLLKIKNMSIYVILYCLDEDLCKIFYRMKSCDTLLDYYAAWGTKFPLCRESFLKPGLPGRMTLLSGQDDPCHVDSALFKDLSPYIVPQFSGRALEPSLNPETSQGIRIRVSLKDADPLIRKTLLPNEIWFVPDSRINALKTDFFCPESELSQVEALTFKTENNQTYIALWNGGSGKDLEKLFPGSLSSPFVTGLYRTKTVDLPLFLPEARILFPKLETNTLESLFDLKNDSFTCILDTDQAPLLFHLEINFFKPLRQALVDYEFITHQEQIQPILSNTLYDFGEITTYPLPEPKPRSSANTDQKTRLPAGTTGESIKTPGKAATNIIEPETIQAKNTQKELQKEEPEPFLKVKKPKTHTELLAEKAEDFITRYDTLSQQDWRRYMLNAAYTGKLQSDTHDALTTLLFFHPKTLVLDNICQALKLEQDWFWSRSPQKMMIDIFDQSWETHPPQVTLFKLYAAKDRLIRGAYVLGDNSLRLALSKLGHQLYQTRNPKLVWLFGRICKEISNDTQAFELSRIQVQNLLMDPKTDPGIPISIRRALTRHFLHQYEQEISCYKSTLQLDGPGTQWFDLFFIFQLEKDRLMTPCLDQADDLLTLLDTKAESYTSRARRHGFAGFLKDCIECSLPHPGLCSFDNHINKSSDEFTSSLIQDLAQPFAMNQLVQTDMDPSSQVGSARQIETFSFNPEKPWQSTLRLLLAAKQAVDLDDTPAVEAVVNKVRSFKKQINDRPLIIQALDMAKAFAVHENDLDSMICDAVNRIDQCPSDTTGTRILVSVVIFLVMDKPLVLNIETTDTLLKILRPCCVLSQDMPEPDVLNALYMIHKATDLIFHILIPKAGVIQSIVRAEKQKIREIVTSEYAAAGK